MEHLTKLSYSLSEDQENKIFTLIIDRINKWSDIDELDRAGELSYFFTAPKYAKEMLYWKGDADMAESLKKVFEIFIAASSEHFADSESVKALIWEYADSVGRGKVLWPLRVALSGREKSPDPFTLVSTLGKEETVKRVEAAIELLK